MMCDEDENYPGTLSLFTKLVSFIIYHGRYMSGNHLTEI